MRGKTDYGIMCLADKVKLSSCLTDPTVFIFTMTIRWDVPLQVRIMEMLFIYNDLFRVYSPCVHYNIFVIARDLVDPTRRTSYRDGYKNI